MLYFKDPGSGEVLFLSRLREAGERWWGSDADSWLSLSGRYDVMSNI